MSDGEGILLNDSKVIELSAAVIQRFGKDVPKSVLGENWPEPTMSNVAFVMLLSLVAAQAYADIAWTEENEY